MKLTSLWLVAFMLVAGCATTQSAKVKPDSEVPNPVAVELDTVQKPGCETIGDLVASSRTRAGLERVMRKKAARMGANLVQMTSVFRGSSSRKIKAIGFALRCSEAEQQEIVLAPLAMLTKLGD